MYKIIQTKFWYITEKKILQKTFQKSPNLKGHKYYKIISKWPQVCTYQQPSPPRNNYCQFQIAPPFRKFAPAKLFVRPGILFWLVVCVSRKSSYHNKHWIPLWLQMTCHEVDPVVLLLPFDRARFTCFKSNDTWKK